MSHLPHRSTPSPDALAREAPPVLRANGHAEPPASQPGGAVPRQPGPGPLVPPAAAQQNLALRPDVTPDAIAFDRDLSWLEFNRRVLAMAEDERTPLLERVKFLAIFSSNLDEFVMKRVGLLKRRMAGEVPFALHRTETTAPADLFHAIRRTMRQLQQQQTACYEQSVRPALAENGIELLDYADLTAAERRRIDAWFMRNVFPILTPLAVDTGHRFPFISNLSRNLGILLVEDGLEAGAEPLFARVKVPNTLPQWIRIPGENEPEPATGSGAAAAGAVGVGGPSAAMKDGRFVSLRELIQNNLDDLFPRLRLAEIVAFRVTRSAAVDIEDDEDVNLLELVEEQLKKRRFARTVRIETGPNPSPAILEPLLEELRVTPDDVDERPGPLDYTTLLEITELDRPELKWRRWAPRPPRRLADKDANIFAAIRQGDLLVHHPYESFAATAERFIAEAARDPDVLAIKQTIYRTSRDSPFISSLIRAAERGKQVAALVELRARFDEQANVRLARMLEKAGVHVAYGVVGLKTHCKASLVVRREADSGGGGLRSYAHLGTGNYHSRTAQMYTDLGLFTCDPAITQDLMHLFNLLTGRSLYTDYNRLLVAPATMRARFLELIAREIDIAHAFGRGESAVGGRIIAKMNAMEDPQISDKLYEASAAGVDITLLVRGFCCIRPGVDGLSENIRVISTVGRYLEHSRIFYFGTGQPDPLDGDWYIGSADWMYRNMEARVEAVCPVLDRTSRATLLRITDAMIRDRREAWDLLADGSYRHRTPRATDEPDSPEALGVFETMIAQAASA
jgi:polyphosphate kinase